MLDVVPRENRIVPLYHQVQQVIRHRIATRQYDPGVQIPSEHELGRELKVSRVTVRRALQQMTEDGLIEGRRVASIGEDQNALMSFTAMSADRGLDASARVLLAEVRDATIDEAERLSVPPGAPLFVLHRTRLLGGVPVVIDESHIPYERVKGIAMRALGR